MALLLGDLDNLAFAEDNSLAMPVILLTIFFAAAIDVRIGLVGVTDNNGRRLARFGKLRREVRCDVVVVGLGAGRLAPM